MAKKISLQVEDLADDQTAKFRDLKCTPIGGEEKTVKALTSEELAINTIPDGYEIETLNLVTESGILTRTILTQTAAKATVKAFGAGDNRAILQINGSGKVIIDSGYLK